MKLPIRTLGLAAGALLIGSALAPVSAQQQPQPQQSGVDGQVALRSDGALYLIIGGQRRWIATASATDEEINALREGDPIFAGLAPQGSAQASAGPAKPSTGATAAKTSSKTTKPTTKTQQSSGERGEDLSEDIPIEVDLGGSTTLGPGDTRTIEIRTRHGVTCELVVEIPDDDDITEDSKIADSRGRCRYTVEIPSGADEGNGKVIGTVRDGGKVNRQEIDIEIED
jgi:hypothetical protein